MTQSAPTQNSAWGESVNFQVKEQRFNSGQYGVPIAGNYSSGQFSGSAIGEYKIPQSSGSTILGSKNGTINWIPSAPSGGTYVLGSINGAIQWIATESCE